MKGGMVRLIIILDRWWRYIVSKCLKVRLSVLKRSILVSDLTLVIVRCMRRRVEKPHFNYVS
jgi:hypothetical protein